MKAIYGLFFIVMLIGCNKRVASRNILNKIYAFDTVPAWRDEFEYDGLPDSTKWSYDIGGSG